MVSLLLVSSAIISLSHFVGLASMSRAIAFDGELLLVSSGMDDRSTGGEAACKIQCVSTL